MWRILKCLCFFIGLDKKQWALLRKHRECGVTNCAKGQNATYDFDAKIAPNPPHVGANTLVVEVRRKSDAKPATGMKIRAQVSMSSMDMGTEEPVVREVAPGRYQVKVMFSMKGPWAVKVLLPAGGEKVLGFEVGRE